MVDKCPNCGQPSRPGARFCTSCGFRLPERPVEPEPSPLTRSPFATTSTVAASWWPSSASAAPTEVPAAEAAGSTAGENQASAERPTAEEGPAAVADEPTAESASGSERAPTAESAPESSSTDRDRLSDWPSFPTHGTPTTAAPYRWDAAPSGDAASSQAGTSEDLAAAVDRLAGDDSVIALGPPSDEAGTNAEPAGTPEHAAPAWFSESAASVATETGAEAPVQSVDGDPLARARSLLDELGALLPSLASPAAATPTVDVAIVAAGLVSARDEADAQQGQLESLMAVVETARARPRDIDVMLDLSRQVEAIAALKAGYDRCHGAIETALAQLGSDPNR